MSVFFDTNVLVYCTDTSNPAKQTRSRQLVAQACLDGDGWVSTQVLIELFNVLTRKQKIPAQAARDVVLSYCAWQVVDSDLALVNAAIDMTLQRQLSIWDAMMVQAAVRCGADTLYTEDLQNGQRFDKLIVVNPFLI